MTLAKRNPAADILRILAFFLVVSVHFFMNNGFYSQRMEGTSMFIMTLMRSFFIICVPLFLTLSGYLLRKKQLEKKYYGRISKILLTYLLSSLLCVLYSAVFLKQKNGITHIILSILGFTAAPYSWYVEMYLGLFLLIPFLNIVYHSLPSQKSKIWLVLTFIILTALPSVLNIYDLRLADWSFSLSASNTHKLFPAWWEALYPITYYYMGCYLSEYSLKINRTLNVILILVLTAVSGSFCYWGSYQTTFVRGPWCDYQSLFNVILTLLVFVLITNINYDKLPNPIVSFVQKLSGLCLGGYLVSWIFDDALYPILLEKVPNVTDRLAYYLVIVPAIFVLSLLASYLLSKIQLMLEKGFSFAYKRIRTRSAPTSK